MVPEKWRLFCHCGPFFTLLPRYGPRKSKFWKNEEKACRYYFTHVYHKWHLYDVWFLRHWARQTQCFVILDCFMPFNNPKNQSFEKLKKTPGDTIILHKCNKNHDHMLYCFWGMTCNGCNCYFSFWAIFCSFTSLTTQKIKIKKKMKETLGDIIISHMCTKNYDRIMYGDWNMVCNGQTDRYTDGWTDGKSDM